MISNMMSLVYCYYKQHRKLALGENAQNQKFLSGRDMKRRCRVHNGLGATEEFHFSRALPWAMSQLNSKSLARKNPAVLINAFFYRDTGTSILK